MSIPRNLSFLAENASSTGVLSIPGGGTNTASLPAFSAYLSANQSASGSTQIIAYNTEAFDTSSCFNNTGSTVGGIPAYSFLPNVAGYYQVNHTLPAFDTVAGQGYLCYIYKNSSAYTLNALPLTSGTSTVSVTVSQIIYLNGTTDNIQAYGRFIGTAPVFYGGATGAYFSATLVRSA